LLEKIISKYNGIKYEISEKEILISLTKTPHPILGRIDAYYTKLYAKSKTSNFPSVVLIIFCPGVTPIGYSNDIKDNFKTTLLSAFKQALFFEKIKENNAEIAESEDKLKELVKKSYEESKGIAIKFGSELIYQFVIDEIGQNLLEFKLKPNDDFEIFSFEYNKSNDWIN
jgi:hypothetical protein